METIAVSLGDRSYDIIIEAGGIGKLGAYLGSLRLGARCAVITDPRVKDLYGQLATESLADAGFNVDVVTFPEGEANKTLATVERLYHAMLSLGLDRKSFVVALGGGLVGDVAGFAAATYMRGIRFVQVPTTLLAQVDASVGGKVGVNLPEGKNLVGCFHQPSLVLIDPEVLRSLDARDLKAGFAEVIKYGIIRDADFFSFLEDNREAVVSLESSAIAKAIAVSCRIKAEVVAEVEREESGLRAILNFGHTVAHAIESVSDYTTYRHGEAVAIGMAVAAEISVKLGHLDKADAGRIASLLRNAGLPVTFSGLDTGQLVSRMRFDKKALGDRIRFVLARKIGEVFLTDDVPLDTVAEVLRERAIA